MSRTTSNLIGYLFSGIGILLVAIFLLQGKSKNSGSELEISPTHIDFGTQLESTVESELEIANHSSRRVEILGVRKSCRCSDVSVPRFIEPHQNILAKTTWDLRGMADESIADLVFSYTYGDTEEVSHVRCRFTANVVPDFRMSRESIDFYLGSEASVVELSLLPDAMKNASISKVTTRHPILSAETRGNDIIVTCQCVDKTTNIDASAEVTIATNSKNVPLVTIPVFFHRIER